MSTIKGNNDAWEDPPPYSESIQANQQESSHVRRGVVDATSQVAHSMLYDEILPRLSSGPYSRPSSMTLVLVPSDVTALQASGTPDSKDPAQQGPKQTLVGFPAAEKPRLIHLTDLQHTADFWRQPEAVKELGTLLVECLKSQGFEVHQVVNHGASSRSAEWKSQIPRSMQENEAWIHVEVKTICLRIENEFGLYETRNGMAVIARIKIGNST